MSFGKVAGGLIGGLLGGGGGGESQTASKEPWEPAREPLINSINTGQDLEQRYYQQNPFNPLQQQGYQNLFADLDQFRNQISPQLMQFANGMMQSNYQRGPRNSQMEAMRGGGGMGGGMQMGNTRPQMMSQGQDGSYAPQGGMAGAMGGIPQGQGDWRGGGGVSAAYNGMPQSGGQGSPGGLLAALGGINQTGMGNFRDGPGMAQAQGAMPQGLLGAAQGVFQAPPQGNYGPLNFTELNPFTSANGIPPAPVEAAKPKPTADEEELERQRRLIEMNNRFA